MYKKRSTLLQHHHLVGFGLRMFERAANGSTVVSTACRFSEVFGKEEPLKVGRKRGRSSRMKYFKAPFRKEYYVPHVERMHMDKWIEHCKLNDAANKARQAKIGAVGNLSDRQRSALDESTHHLSHSGNYFVTFA